MTEEEQNSLKDMATDLGHLFQVQDDYLDIFGNQEIRVGTSIPENKISWFVVRAYERATLKQKLILQVN